MKTHVVTLTYQDCAARYELSETELRTYADLGLLGADAATNTIQAEPDHLALLSRLRHELGLSAEGIDVVLAMRRRLLALQRELVHQRARARQLEHLLGHAGPTHDADDWL